jgi:hypothetical protein
MRLFSQAVAGVCMRVLFWTDWFLPSIGGVEVFSARLLPDLVRRGHEITVVSTGIVHRAVLQWGALSPGVPRKHPGADPSSAGSHRGGRRLHRLVGRRRPSLRRCGPLPSARERRSGCRLHYRSRLGPRGLRRIPRAGRPVGRGEDRAPTRRACQQRPARLLREPHPELLGARAPGRGAAVPKIIR